MFGVFCLSDTYISFQTLKICTTINSNSRNQSSVSPELADGPPAAVIPLADVGEEVEIPEEDEEYHHVHNHQLGKKYFIRNLYCLSTTVQMISNNSYCNAIICAMRRV